MSIEATEAEAAAKAVSPFTRVRLVDIEANISYEGYTTGTHLMTANQFRDNREAFDSLRCFTLCTIVLKNGFVVIGKAAPADPANYDAELGRKFAREDAIRQIWPIMGYALREKLYQGWE